jgi:hypothetical protein
MTGDDPSSRAEESNVWPTLDGNVEPEEYDCRIDTSRQPARAYPQGGPMCVQFYYGFDGASFNFGLKKTRPCRTLGAHIRLDPDSNGAEVGDVFIAVCPEDRLYSYGIYEGLLEAQAVAGTPPDPRAAGVLVKCSAEGDIEVWVDLETQFHNGMDPNPLEPSMVVHIAIQVEVDGHKVTNYVNGVVSTAGGPKLEFE